MGYRRDTLYGIQAGYRGTDMGYRQDTLYGIQAGYTIWDTGRIHFTGCRQDTM